MPEKAPDRPSEQAPSRARIVTAYTLGNPAETDETPCIGAFGHDLCELVASGTSVCATNEFPARTELAVGEMRCIVLDRTNERYAYRVDIAMLDRGEAVEFGRQILEVREVVPAPPQNNEQDMHRPES